MYTLILVNNTTTPRTYASGNVSLPASGTVTPSSVYFFALNTDSQLRSDIAQDLVSLSDGVASFATTDAILYLDRIIGAKDRDGNGITSTTIITDLIEHQGLDVNIVSGASNGLPDRSTFTYGDTSFVPVGGVFNDTSTTIPSGRTGAARITAERSLHVNLRDESGGELGTTSNPLVIEGSVSTNVGTRTVTYAESLGVVQGVTTLVGSSTSASNRYLEKVYFSGTNIAEYELTIDGVTVDKKRTAHGASLNDYFDFGLGYLVTAGQTINVYAVHYRPFVGDFNVRFQLLGV